MLNVSCVIFALNMCKFQWRLMSLAFATVWEFLNCTSVCKTTLLSSLQNCLISFPRLQRRDAIFVLWFRRLQFAQLVHGGLGNRTLWVGWTATGVYSASRRVTIVTLNTSANLVTKSVTLVTLEIPLKPLTLWKQPKNHVHCSNWQQLIVSISIHWQKQKIDNRSKQAFGALANVEVKIFPSAMINRIQTRKYWA